MASRMMAIYAFMKMESKRSMESTSNKLNKIWNFSITIPMCHTLFLPTEIFILCEQQNTSQRALYVYIDMISLSHGHMMGIVVVVVSQSPQNKCWWVYTVCFLVWVDSIHSQNLLSRRIVYPYDTQSGWIWWMIRTTLEGYVAEGW